MLTKLCETGLLPREVLVKVGRVRYLGLLSSSSTHRVLPVARHAVTRSLDAAELLGVHVKHLARRYMLIAHDPSPD